MPVKNNVTAETFALMPAADVRIWTVGSSRDGNEDGCSGVFIIENTLGQIKIVSPAGIVASSCRAELTFLSSLDWMAKNVEFTERKDVRIFTDSKTTMWS